MRIVVKVGSAVLTSTEKKDCLSQTRMTKLVEFLVNLQNENEVILVSSGAVSAGYTQIQLDRSIIENKQALAAIGQPILMKRYIKYFLKYKKKCAQVLVTARNFEKPNDIKRVQSTIDILLENKIIPIVNENDVTAIDELKIGDNDQLSAYITKYTNSNMLIILSDIDAYYNNDPRKHSDAKVLKVVHEIADEELTKEVTPHNIFATGGIVTKLKAASYLLDAGIDMFLSDGFILNDVKSFTLEKKHMGGTLFTKAQND